MKILFTGGNGFIGKEIIPLLINDGYDVYAPTSKELNLIDNLSVKKYFDENGFDYDVIIHSAVVGGRRWKTDGYSVFFDNLKMFENISLYSNKVSKFINFDSGASLFGSQFIPSSPYGFAKYCIAKNVFNFDNGINLKIFGCFGIYEQKTRFFATNIKNYIDKKPMVIFKNRLMDFIYVKDLYKILKYVLENDNLIDKNIDCVYKEKYSLKNIAEFINYLDKHKVPIVIENDDMDFSYCGKLSVDLNFIGLQKGMSDYYKLKEII